MLRCTRMLRALPVFSVCCFLLSFSGLFAQTGSDTLEWAKKLRNEKRLQEAFTLLETYRANHPGDLNASWLSAQTAYWMKKNKTSEMIYEKAIQAHPDNYILKLDYALVLFNIGEIDKAKPLLNTYLQYDSTNAEALTVLAQILSWQSNYTEALRDIKKVLLINPKDKQALALQEKILSAAAPWVKISIAHSSDDQPLKNTTTVIEGGSYISALSFPHISMQLPTLVTANNTYHSWWFGVGNKSIFSKQKMELNLDLGLLKYPDSSKSKKITWNLQLDKTIIKHLLFSVQAERKPYLYTLSSLNNTVVDNHYSLSLAWNDPDKWNVRTAYDIDRFNDNNSITTFSAWCMSPPLKVSIVEFHLGYGFNYSTTQENRFVAVKSLQDIIDSSYYHPALKGIYNPYFTPDKQLIHSVIISIVIHPLKTLDIGAKAGYGFSAVNQCPYLYLNKDANDSAYIAKGYFKENYSPADFSMYAAWDITKKISCKAEYIYSKTNFYKSNYVGLACTLRMR